MINDTYKQNDIVYIKACMIGGIKSGVVFSNIVDLHMYIHSENGL